MRFCEVYANLRKKWRGPGLSKDVYDEGVQVTPTTIAAG